MVCIAFLSNKLTLRGTEVAMYDYADHNETLLHNNSIIFTRSYEDTKDENDADLQAHLHFRQRFRVVYYSSYDEIDNLIKTHGVDILYCIKSGRLSDDEFTTNACPFVVHAVFESDQPHGDAFAVVGNTVNQLHGTKCPVVPHMIRTHPTTENLRSALGIPENALIFGRYGGMQTFDIFGVMKFVHEWSDPHVYFLFMGTKQFTNNPQTRFIPASPNMEFKRKFINTCDAMLHARAQGETFGLACGEFALAGKPVLTCGLSKERNHIDILGRHALLYNNERELGFLIRNFRTIAKYVNMHGTNPYLAYTPEIVMRQFHRIFIEPFVHDTKIDDNST